MSSNYIKTTYECEGAYGVNEKHTLYCQHNNCSDIVTFYEEDGTCLFNVSDTIDNNLFTAIDRLFNAYNNDDLNSNVEIATSNDINIIKNYKPSLNHVGYLLSQLSVDDRDKLIKKFML